MLFHPSRLWLQLTTWAVVGVIVGLVFSTGVGVLSMTPPAFRTARICFIASALILLIKLVQWLLASTATNLERVILSVICGGGIVLALMFSLVWVQRYQEATLKSRAEANNELPRLIKGLEEKHTREALLKRYPLGYVVFDLEYTNAVLPYDQQLPAGFQLDWKGVGFTSITKDSYTLRLPSMLKEGQVLLENPTVSGPKQVDGLANGVAIDDTFMLAEILAITDRGMIFVVGFKNIPGANTSK